jgi:hypothetical protein
MARGRLAGKVLGALALAAALAAAPRGGAPLVAQARAEAPWLDEFSDVCGRTQDAMSLDDATLKDLVSRCDQLKPQVERLEGPQRKVYLRRLETCRALYQFVLDSRAAGPAK